MCKNRDQRSVYYGYRNSGWLFRFRAPRHRSPVFSHITIRCLLSIFCVFLVLFCGRRHTLSQHSHTNANAHRQRQRQTIDFIMRAVNRSIVTHIFLFNISFFFFLSPFSFLFLSRYSWLADTLLAWAIRVIRENSA